MAVRREEWLRLIDAEYLRGFISDGGAAVKFAVLAAPEDAPRLLAELG
jgi:hypothetical protein